MKTLTGSPDTTTTENCFCGATNVAPSVHYQSRAFKPLGVVCHPLSLLSLLCQHLLNQRSDGHVKGEVSKRMYENNPTGVKD